MPDENEIDREEMDSLYPELTLDHAELLHSLHLVNEEAKCSGTSLVEIIRKAAQTSFGVLKPPSHAERVAVVKAREVLAEDRRRQQADAKAGAALVPAKDVA